MKTAVVAIAFLTGVSACAQDTAAPQDQSGVEAAQQPPSEYGGPTILSRGGAPSVFRGTEMLRISPFFAVMADYSSYGSSGSGAQDNSGYKDTLGVIGAFGLTGTHNWRHTLLDIDYRGTYRNNSQYSQYNGLDNSVSLGLQHQLTSRLGINLTENASRARGFSSLPLGGLYDSGMPGYNPIYNALTANSVLETPTVASVTNASMVYQWTMRWSVSAGGTGIITRQHAQDTYGVNGSGANGDIAYRISRYQSLSFNYSFVHFGYLGQFGQTDIHSEGLSYSIRIGRYWELGASAGASRVESLRAVAVPLDPILAALLGQSIIFEKMYNVIWTPYGGMHLTRTFHHASWGAAYDRSVTPGNGVYSTSTFEMASTGFSYTGIRRLTLQAGASYSRYSAVTQSLGRYRGYSVGGGFGYSLGKGFSLTARADGRRYRIENSALDRTSYDTGLGLSWHPGSYPVAIW